MNMPIEIFVQLLNQVVEKIESKIVLESLIPKLVPVKLNGKYGYVCGGKLVTPCQFDDFSHWFFEGLAAVKMGDNGDILTLLVR